MLMDILPDIQMKNGFPHIFSNESYVSAYESVNMLCTKRMRDVNGRARARAKVRICVVHIHTASMIEHTYCV